MDRVAVVTGAGSGIGRAVAHSLLSEGYCVVLAGRTRASLEETARQAPPDTRSLVAATDVTEEVSVDALFAKAVAAFDRIDLLFNNAGKDAPGLPIDELSIAQWKAVVDVNLTGAFLCARAAFRQMKTQDPRGGRIINNGSIAAHAPRPRTAPYAASKHAITGLTKSLSLDGRAHNIACGQIDIGNAATAMTAAMSRGVLQADGTVKTEPTMDMRHVADAVLYMAQLPLDANVQFMTVTATNMPFIGRG